MAATICPYCEEPIGYDRGFYTPMIAGQQNICHSSCLEEQIEAERKQEKKQ